MPVNLQHLQSLLGVSSLSDVKINDSGKLEKRSGIRALFARIGEFFQSLSAGGRAAIAARNEAVVSAMRQAVNEARTDAQPQAQQISRRLATVTDSLATAMKETRAAAKKDVISKLHDDQRFKALPLRSRQTLERTLTDIADNMPVSDWKTHMDTVKNYFFLPLPPARISTRGCRSSRIRPYSIFSSLRHRRRYRRTAYTRPSRVTPPVTA